MMITQEKNKLTIETWGAIITFLGALAEPSFFHDWFSYNFQIKNFEFSVLQTICIVFFIFFAWRSLKQLFFWKEKEFKITQDSIQELNHFIVKEIFKTEMLNLEITVNPINSPYWRLGLRFYKDKKLAKSEPIPRTADSKFAEIHIGAGDRQVNGIWITPYNFYLTWYLLPDRKDDCIGYRIYQSNSEIKFTMGNDREKKFFMHCYKVEKISNHLKLI